MNNIKYYIEHNQVFSSLVYPLDKGFYYDILIDKKYIESKLKSQYNVKSIANKYVVEITCNSGNVILVVNHDGEYYAINKAINN